MTPVLSWIFAQCSQVSVPEATEEALRFYKSGNLLWALQQLSALAIPLLFFIRGFTGKLASFTKRLARDNWFFSIACYLVLFLLLYQLLCLPVSYYADFVWLHEYGLSNQSLSRWFENYGKSTLLSAVGLVAFGWIFYLLLKKSPRRWWLYSGAVLSAISFFILFIQPVWIDPLFYTFGPMKNQALEKEIQALAERAGIEHGKIFEVDMSQDTTLMNAYVTGFGKTGRIVLWDTLTQEMSPDQVLAVMGHEMGHYVLHHVWWDWLYFSFLSTGIFFLTDRSARFFLRRFRKRLGFTHLETIASLPLLLFFFTLFSLLTEPLSNFVSRHLEHEADRFALEITQNNQAAAEAFLLLQEKDLGNPYPGPIYTFWQGTHPSLGSRIEFSNKYCPWLEQKPLKYGRYFKQS